MGTPGDPFGVPAGGRGPRGCPSATRPRRARTRRRPGPCSSSGRTPAPGPCSGPTPRPRGARTEPPENGATGPPGTPPHCHRGHPTSGEPPKIRGTSQPRAWGNKSLNSQNSPKFEGSPSLRGSPQTQGTPKFWGLPQDVTISFRDPQTSGEPPSPKPG